MVDAGWNIDALGVLADYAFLPLKKWLTAMRRLT